MAHSVPRLTGLSGSPSMRSTRLSRTEIRTPQPPWQPRHVLLTVRSLTALGPSPLRRRFSFGTGHPRPRVLPGEFPHLRRPQEGPQLIPLEDLPVQEDLGEAGQGLA